MLLNSGTARAVVNSMGITLASRRVEPRQPRNMSPDSGAGAGTEVLAAGPNPVRYRAPTGIRWVLGVAGLLVATFTVSLIVRANGSSFTPVDGWGVSIFEVVIGVVCLLRYFESSWRASSSAARLFPLAIGAACIAWGAGDLALTTESLGGADPPMPSTADAFYVGFFVLCFLAFAILIRRGNRSSLTATCLDGTIAGLGVATVSAAFVVAVVMSVTGDGALASATNLAYPLGDILLLALCMGGLAVLPRGFRPLFLIASVALAVNAIGDGFNLLQPSSKIGYIANGVAWPISLTLLAVAVWILRPDVEASGTDRVAGFVLPGFGAAIALIVLFVASFGHIGRPAVALATITLLVAGVRVGMTVREAQSLKTARFRSLIDKTWDLITVIEADLRVAYVTPSSQRVLGYPAAELEGKPFMDFVHPEDAQRVIAHLSALTDGTSGADVFEIRMRHANGEYRTIDWNAADLLDDPGVNGYVLNGGDVTEARQAARELVAARDAALVASRTKSEFVSTMSHEIRTPMNGVIGLTDLLLQTHLSSDQLELATGVKVSAESLLVIINDILDFSKMEAGKLEIEETAVNVPGVVDDVGRILAGTAHAKGIELLVDVSAEVPTTLLGDETRIRQVLLNFSSNAVKFTSEGEVVVRVGVLHRSTERVALRFEVVDTGIGIAPEEQERLFSAFAQADSSTTRRFGGTGLGLTISRQLIELMDGKLGMTSTPGEGSTFWFELSLRRSEEVAKAEPGADPRTLSGQRALVVDDNATNRRILRQQLVSWGVEAIEAVDGFQALEIAGTAVQEGRGFDLGVVDLNMPGMDGLELARAMKADPSTADTVLFLLSSSGHRLDAAESHLSGFAASLTKPVRASELFDCLITSLHAGAPIESPATPATARPETSEVHGMILLVEDNKVNQLVGSKVLESLGYQFTIANNGREAVEAVQDRHYDAILMDCQMPEMDGYEATETIRRIAGPIGQTPIIAMTAAAMDGDREKCMAAGMDDFITKPVRLDAVSTALQRWVTDGVGPDGGSGKPEDAPEIAGLPDPIDREQIELLLSLDDGLGETLAEVVEEYLSVSDEGRTELRRLVRARDTGALERAAHTLKGASANVGARGVAEVCARLEANARNADLDGAESLVDEYDTEFERVRDALEAAAASAKVT